MEMEKQMGLFDMSDMVFDEEKPEQDPSMLAAFLNSSLFSAFSNKKEDASAQARRPPVAPEMQIVPVEVPAGLHKTTLRDAMLQWRLRHTAHPRELEAVDWLVGQLDPTGFELRAVKVPEQARLLLIEALLQHTQLHAAQQLDACHAVRVAAVLQALTPRLHGVEVQLPDDGKGTDRVREIVCDALKDRVSGKADSKKRDITQEEGFLLQCVPHKLPRPTHSPR